jgi:hypothetical protein
MRRPYNAQGNNRSRSYCQESINLKRMAMTNQTPITAFVDKVKHWIENYQNSLKVKPAMNSSNRSSSEETLEPDVPLEIGSELLITDEIVKMFDGLSNARGRVVIIDSISMKEKEVIKASAFGIQINVNMQVAQKMRQAFLRRERLPL